MSPAKANEEEGKEDGDLRVQEAMPEPSIEACEEEGAGRTQPPPDNVKVLWTDEEWRLACENLERSWEIEDTLEEATEQYDRLYGDDDRREMTALIATDDKDLTPEALGYYDEQKHGREYEDEGLFLFNRLLRILMLR